MFELIYANEADNDLQAIYDYIAQDNPERASSYLSEIEKQILHLRDFPNIGSESKYAELRVQGIRILPFEDYLIFHTVNEKSGTVNIVRVLRGSVNYKHLF